MTKSLCTKIKDKVTQFDLFNHSQFLRYRAESQYRSFNGGLCSLVIIIGFIFIFTIKFGDVINKTEITSAASRIQEKEPSALTINTSQLFFAIGVSFGYGSFTNAIMNLNNPDTKVFDISLLYYYKTKQISYSEGNLKLVPCSRQDWVAAYPDIGETFDRQQLSKWICIAPNQTLKFQGKYASQIFYGAKFIVYGCYLDIPFYRIDNRTCRLNSYGWTLRFNTYFMNPLINPNDQNYLGSYLDDKNQFPFSNSTSTTAEIYISDYNIQSDVSLLPTTDIVQESGFIVQEPTKNFAQPTTSSNNVLIKLQLRKSSLSVKVTRSFQKYLDFFSYIGGLFGALMTAFFIMSYLNESSFQIEVASKNYTQTKEEKIKSKHFNIITYFGYAFYRVVHYFGANPEWKLFKQFNNASQQMSKQLDINLLLKKIRFLQDCMGYLFQDFQLKCLYLKDKHTLNQAVKQRRKFSSRSYLLKLKKKRMKQEQNNKNNANQTMDPPKPIYELNSLEQMMEKRRGQLTTSKQYLNESPHPSFEQKKEHAKSINMQQKEQPRERQIMTRLQELPNDSDRYQQAHIDDDQSSQDLSSLDETEQKQLYQNVLDSINTLKDEASKGKPRCVEIFNSLDDVVKQVAGIPKQQIKSDLSLAKSQSMLQNKF